jgi:hypothetical protein
MPQLTLFFCADPYCSVQCAAGLTIRDKWRSKTHAGGGKTPSWNEKHTFNVVEGDDRLNIQVYDEDTGKDDLIGSVCIDLNSLYQRGTRDEFFPLTTTTGKPAGEIRVVLQFQSQGGAPGAPPPNPYGAPPGAPPPGYGAPTGAPFPGYGAPPGGQPRAPPGGLPPNPYSSAPAQQYAAPGYPPLPHGAPGAAVYGGNVLAATCALLCVLARCASLYAF